MQNASLWLGQNLLKKFCSKKGKNDYARIKAKINFSFSFFAFFLILYFFGTTEKTQKKHLKDIFTPLKIKIS